MSIADTPVWKIDHSTDSPILTYNGCSVIQDEQAYYVLSLIGVAGGQDDPWREVREIMSMEPKFDWDNNKDGAARQHFVDYTQRTFLNLLYGAVARAIQQ